MLGIKQETLAAELNMTQQAFSKLEQKEQIEDEMLDKIVKILHVSTEALKTMSEEATINYFKIVFQKVCKFRIDYFCNAIFKNE